MIDTYTYQGVSQEGKICVLHELGAGNKTQLGAWGIVSSTVGSVRDQGAKPFGNLWYLVLNWYDVGGLLED